MELPAQSSPSGPTGSLVALGVSFPISKSSVVVEASALAGDLGFNLLMLSSTDEIILSEFEQSSGSALPDCAVGRIVVMVGDSLPDAFTRGELLAERLASCAVLGMVVPSACVDSFLVSFLVVKSRAGIFECVVTSTIEVQ